MLNLELRVGSREADSNGDDHSARDINAAAAPETINTKNRPVPTEGRGTMEAWSAIPKVSFITSRLAVVSNKLQFNASFTIL